MKYYFFIMDRGDAIMSVLLLSAIAATLFGITAVLYLGHGDLVSYVWVDVVFWSLIGAGVALAAINIAWECLPCRVSRLWQRGPLSKRLCGKSACLKPPKA